MVIGLDRGVLQGQEHPQTQNEIESQIQVHSTRVCTDIANKLQLKLDLLNIKFNCLSQRNASRKIKFTVSLEYPLQLVLHYIKRERILRESKSF